uniref:Uncharacterized protein n=1 Tax=Bactrocera latifrons TaxID=174628 RepID=A0A0K8UFR0_BACLA
MQCAQGRHSSSQPKIMIANSFKMDDLESEKFQLQPNHPKHQAIIKAREVAQNQAISIIWVAESGSATLCLSLTCFPNSCICVRTLYARIHMLFLHILSSNSY